MNTLYRKAGQSFLNKEISWTSDAIKVVLLNADYVVNTNIHEYLSDISTQMRVSISPLIENKNTADGYATGEGIVFYSLFGNEPVTSLVIFIDSGDPATSKLIAYIDEAAGLPFTPAGKDYYVIYDLIFGGFFRV